MSQILMSSTLMCTLFGGFAEAGFRYDLRFSDGAKTHPAEPGTYLLDAIAIVWGENASPSDDGVMSGRLNLFSQAVGDSPFESGGVVRVERIESMNNTSVGLGGIAHGTHIPKWSDDGVADWGSAQRFRGSTASPDFNPTSMNLYFRGSSNPNYQGAPVVTGGGAVGNASALVPGAWEIPVARFELSFTADDLSAARSGATMFRLRGNNSAPGSFASWSMVEDGRLPPVFIGREYGASFDDAYVTFVSQGYTTQTVAPPSQNSDFLGLAYEPVGLALGSLGDGVFEGDVPAVSEGNLDLSHIFSAYSDDQFVVRVDLEGDLSGLPTDPNWQSLFTYPQDDFEILLHPSSFRGRLNWLSWSTFDMPFVVDRVRIDLVPASVPEPTSLSLFILAACCFARRRNRVQA